jgi:hypothetical protein
VADTVRAYLDYNAAGEERYLEFYRVQRTLADAVEKSAMAELPSGKRFSHQRRIPRAVLAEAKAGLLRADLKSCGTFDKLLQLVTRTVGGMHGIGELTIYDTAHRIGAYLRLRPEFVYVHAGVRTGLRALGLNHRVSKLTLKELPRAFWKLRPEQAEDCLCIYKRKLAQARK